MRNAPLRIWTRKAGLWGNFMRTDRRCRDSEENQREETMAMWQKTDATLYATLDEYVQSKK